MSALTGNTAGSLKKMWPPVKRKALDAHESFGKLLGTAAANAAGEGTASAGPKPAVGGKKRKATHDEPEEDSGDAAETAPTDTMSGDNKSDVRKKAASREKKVPAAKKTARPRKQAKKEEDDVEMMADGGEQSADQGDGAGEHALTQNVYNWLNDTDGECIDKDVKEEEEEV